MSGLYAMRRANGDWFALDERGGLRVPVFRSGAEAMAARTLNMGMLLFKPAALDGRALGELTSADGAGAVSFWLVDDPSAKLKHGRPVEHAELARLVRAGRDGENGVPR